MLKMMVMMVVGGLEVKVLAPKKRDQNLFSIKLRYTALGSL